MGPRLALLPTDAPVARRGPSGPLANAGGRGYILGSMTTQDFVPSNGSIRSVTVYCSSSANLPGSFYELAWEMGAAIGRAGWGLVYGGNTVGMMDKVARGVRAAGGRVVGVTPRSMAQKGIADEACHQLHITQDMRTRKAMMEELGDAFVALPGGIGTLEEFFEIIVGRSLGYHRKPVVLVNFEGYYQPLLDMFDHGIRRRFVRPSALDLFYVATSVGEVVAYLETASFRGDGSDSAAAVLDAAAPRG